LNIITSIRNRIISLFHEILIPNHILIRQRLKNMIFWLRTISIFIEIYICKISMISSLNILIYKSIRVERSTFQKIYGYIYDWKRMLISKALNYCINRIKFLLMNESLLTQSWINFIIKINSNELLNRYSTHFQSL
jgi:hypothetical protein